MTTTTTSEQTTPPVTSTIDVEVDLEVLRSLPKQFAIDSADAANWLLRKIAAARQYAVNVKEWAAREQRRAEREEMTLLFLFQRQLETWAKGEIDKLNGRRKSIALPAGTVGYRSQAAKLVFDHDHEVLSWARESCPDAIHTTERVGWTEVNAHFESSGELPDGAHIQPAYERFMISTPTAKSSAIEANAPAIS